MFGLVVLIAMLLYLSLLVWATWRGWRWGVEEKGWGGKKRLLGATIGFLIIYLPVFWDWIPTVAMHQYYCSKESGFWIYKSLAQWKAENPGVMETLVDNSPNEYPNWPRENWHGKIIASINQRFGMSSTNHLANSSEREIFPNIWRWKTELIDKRNGDVLARQIDFSSGNDGYIGGLHSLRFWLEAQGCKDGNQYSREFLEFIRQFKGARK